MSDAAKPGMQPGPPPGSPPASEDPGRRELLGTIALGAGTCVALAAATPAALALLAPIAAEVPTTEAPFLDVAAEADVTTDQPLRVELRAMRRDGWLTTETELGAAWLVRTPGGLRAYSATCPHLGCSIEKYPSGFYCPCHQSHFDGLGASKSGPSPRSLDPLPVRVVQGRVQVQALRFAAGGPTRRVIG